MATTTKPAARGVTLGQVTLHELTEEYRVLGDWIEEHADEILVNGGVPTPALEELLAALDGDFETKLGRLILVCREFATNAGVAEGAKKAVNAESARLLQKQQMWENAEKSLRRYAQRQMEAVGRLKVKTTLATVWVQENQPKLAHGFDNAALVAIHDAEERDALADFGNPTPTEPPPPPHPLARFVTVQRVATLDEAALLMAYEARRVELEADVEPMGPSDLPADVAEQIDWIEDTAERETAKARAVEQFRARYVRERLDAEFPGITVTRSASLRIR